LNALASATESRRVAKTVAAATRPPLPIFNPIPSTPRKSALNHLFRCAAKVKRSGALERCGKVGGSRDALRAYLHRLARA